MVRRLSLLLLLSALSLGACSLDGIKLCGGFRETPLAELNKQLQVGDVVFVQVSSEPYTRIAAATRTWTNHVGVVVEVSAEDALIAESTVPVSRTTKFSQFARASAGERIAVMRLNTPLDEKQKSALRKSVDKRLGIAYDHEFNLNSTQMFCSKFVREVLMEASGVQVGEAQTLKALFAANQSIDLAYWRNWYKGSIPWEMETVTPASLYRSSRLKPVFDGRFRV